MGGCLLRMGSQCDFFFIVIIYLWFGDYALFNVHTLPKDRISLWTGQEQPILPISYWQGR